MAHDVLILQLYIRLIHSQGENNMGVAGIGGALASAGTQYDFTKMTNRQLYNAASTLESEGKISHDDAGALISIAQGIDYAPISGPGQSVAQILADPTQHNFIEEVQGDNYGAHMGGSFSPIPYDSMLKDLESYQTNSTSSNNSTLSITA